MPRIAKSRKGGPIGCPASDRILASVEPPGHRNGETLLDSRFSGAAQQRRFDLVFYCAAAELLGGGARTAAGRSRFMIARPKPRITSPPINAGGRIERTTVSDVATVRPRVWLMLRSISARNGIVRNLGEILPDAVIDDDHVGDGIANQGQQRRRCDRILVAALDHRRPMKRMNEFEHEQFIG